MQSIPANELSGPRLLLCDDSPVERMALAHYLRRSGFQVDEAGDGSSALHHLKNREVDLVLLDLHMPDVDGFHVLGYLQEHRRALPVILLSGMPPDEIQQEMRGMKEPELPPLFMKPIDPEQLVQVVELHLAGQLPGQRDSDAELQDPLVP